MGGGMDRIARVPVVTVDRLGELISILQNAPHHQDVTDLRGALVELRRRMTIDEGAEGLRQIRYAAAGLPVPRSDELERITAAIAASRPTEKGRPRNLIAWEIIAILAEQGEKNEDIARRAGVSRDAVQRALRELRKTGLVCAPARGTNKKRENPTLQQVLMAIECLQEVKKGLK